VVPGVFYLHAHSNSYKISSHLVLLSLDPEGAQWRFVSIHNNNNYYYYYYNRVMALCLGLPR